MCTLLLAICCLLLPHSLPGLELGQKAPPLTGATWLKGEPASIDGGAITIVVCWATWCRPFVEEAMPYLSSLHLPYPELVIVGITNQEPEAV